MLEWYEELGMDSNPFDGPAKTIGNDEILDELFYNIISGNMLFIEGKEGSGKTNLLREAVKRFGGRKKVIYLNCKKLSNGLNIERVLKNRYGLLGRFFNIKPKNMILLLDEIEHLSEKNNERIKYYYDLNHLRSVVFVSRQYGKVELHDSIKDRISKVLALKSLSDYEAVKLIRERIGENHLSDRAIKKIYQHSDKNVGKLISNCKQVLKQMAQQKKQKIDDDEVEQFLGVAK